MTTARLSRRALLAGATAGVLTAATSARADLAAAPAPVLFVSHGSPLYAPPDAGRIAGLAAWGKTIATPRGFVVMTPHFAQRASAVGSVRQGFAMYNLPGRMKRNIPPDLDYPSPPSEHLATSIEAALASRVARAPRRGFDHTTWMPLLAMFPAASAPVVELSYGYGRDRELFDVGRRLAPLRDEGLVFLASGGMTHNLAAASGRIGAAAPVHDAPPPSWSVEFDAWAAERLAQLDVDALIDWRSRAPAAELAHPDDGAHFRVLLVALGVALGGRHPAKQVTFPVVGHEGALSTRCVSLAG